MKKKSTLSGKMYDLIISPLLKSIRKNIVIILPDHVSIIEIGCGTGKLAQELNAKIKTSYLGIDLSESMILRAKSKNLDSKYEFRNRDFLKVQLTQKFDYAIFPMIIHSIDKKVALQLLNKASLIAKQIIIADYQIPQPKNYKGWLVAFIERLAGKDHYTSFQDFKNICGIEYYKDQINLKEIERIDSDVFQVVKLKLKGEANE